MNKDELKAGASLMMASANGTKLQFRAKNEPNSAWQDCMSDPKFNFEYFEYRVKPVEKLIPYDDMNSFVYDMHHHSFFIKNIYTGDVLYMIVTVSLEGVLVLRNTCDVIYHDFLTWTDLYQRYKWEDDSPCGIKRII